MPWNLYIRGTILAWAQVTILSGSVVVLSGMSFHLANIAVALDLANEAISEATMRLEDCHAQVCSARVHALEPLPEEIDIQRAIEALKRIKQSTQSRSDTVTQQLKVVQMNFMIEAETQRVHVGTTHSETVRPVHDLSSLPRRIDHDGETVRETSSDGMSYAGTVVRGGIGPSTASSSYQATSEQLPFQ